MPLINRRTIQNVDVGYIPIPAKKLRSSDIKDGMIVDIEEDHKTNEEYLVVSTKNATGKIRFDIDDYDGDFVLVRPEDNPSGFSFWMFDQFKKDWPRHIDWKDDVMITKVWRTHIDTSEMDSEKLKRTMNSILGKLQDS